MIPLESCTYSLADVSGFKQKVLSWLKGFSTFCFLDNQQYAVAPQEYELLVGVGITDFIEGADLGQLDTFLTKNRWYFGHLAYHLSLSIHHFTSAKKDRIGFAPYYFFVPQIVIEIKEALVVIHAEKPDAIFRQINLQAIDKPSAFIAIYTQAALSKEQYIGKIEKLREHILRGDCYEINFCQELFSEDCSIDPFDVYQKLTAISPNPFSAFYKLNDTYVLCASPERFLKKTGNKVLSQPIKGTIKRSLQNEAEDQALKSDLQQSQKDQSENVMVVDLVRNDLSRICNEGSVVVEELYGIYSYPQVHQMISTISGELKDNMLFSEILHATFPMGSMTGAPKHRVMQLIEEYEPSARGLFSGSIGYIKPGGDFDFNVVIRSIMYNAANRYLTYQVGSGITFHSNAESEWKECLVKVEGLKKALEG